MKITLTEPFQKDFASLSSLQKQQALSVLLNIPKVVGEPHKHRGIGIRKIHHSGIFEVRVGLGLRLIFGFKEKTIFLHRMGNHDEIRRYLKRL